MSRSKFLNRDRFIESQNQSDGNEKDEAQKQKFHVKPYRKPRKECLDQEEKADNEIDTEEEMGLKDLKMIVERVHNGHEVWGGSEYFLAMKNPENFLIGAFGGKYLFVQRAIPGLHW